MSEFEKNKLYLVPFTLGVLTLMFLLFLAVSKEYSCFFFMSGFSILSPSHRTCSRGVHRGNNSLAECDLNTDRKIESLIKLFE